MQKNKSMIKMMKDHQKSTQSIDNMVNSELDQNRNLSNKYESLLSQYEQIKTE